MLSAKVLLSSASHDSRGDRKLILALIKVRTAALNALNISFAILGKYSNVAKDDVWTP